LVGEYTENIGLELLFTMNEKDVSFLLVGVFSMVVEFLDLVHSDLLHTPCLFLPKCKCYYLVYLHSKVTQG
jgi:putative component of membrane protein insertase Oxa1/YidC/SpoIIIJ protein YidD